MKIIIDFNDSGFSEKDFEGRDNLEKLLVAGDIHLETNQIITDRPTHSCAIEFWDVIIYTRDLLVVQHCGGAL